jgi:hypothetical protein
MTGNSESLPRQLAALLDCSTDCLLLTEPLISTREDQLSPGGVNWGTSVFLKFEMGENIATNNVLVKGNSLFTTGMQETAGVHARLQIRLELLTQIEVLFVNTATLTLIPPFELASQMKGILPSQRLWHLCACNTHIQRSSDQR